MKTLLCVLLFFCMVESVYCQKNTIQKLELIKATPVPYERIRRDRGQDPRYGLTEKEIPLPLFEYLDFSGTMKTTWRSGGNIFRLFKPEASAFVLVAAEIGVSECVKQQLITYDKAGSIIDYIEVEIGFFGNEEYITSKQWRIDKDMQIQVCQVKPVSSKPILFLDNYYKLDSIEGQRIDTYYKIDKSGKFHQVKQIKYKPRVYERSFFADENKNIWNSGDVVLNESKK